MRLRPTHMLVVVVILTLSPPGSIFPATTLDIAGIKDDIYVHEASTSKAGSGSSGSRSARRRRSLNSDTLAGTRDTIERRVNELGVSEPLIQTRGDNQIIVELPGLTTSPILEDGNIGGCIREEYNTLLEVTPTASRLPGRR